MSRLFISWDSTEMAVTVGLTVEAEEDDAQAIALVAELARRALREAFDPVTAVGKQMSP